LQARNQPVLLFCRLSSEVNFTVSNLYEKFDLNAKISEIEEFDTVNFGTIQVEELFRPFSYIF